MIRGCTENQKGKTKISGCYWRLDSWGKTMPLVRRILDWFDESEKQEEEERILAVTRIQARKEKLEEEQRIQEESQAQGSPSPLNAGSDESPVEESLPHTRLSEMRTTAALMEMTGKRRGVNQSSTSQRTCLEQVGLLGSSCHEDRGERILGSDRWDRRPPCRRIKRRIQKYDAGERQRNLIESSVEMECCSGSGFREENKSKDYAISAP